MKLSNCRGFFLKITRRPSISIVPERLNTENISVAELSPKKRKAKDSGSPCSPNAKKISPSLNKTTPRKKTKLPSTPERGQPTLTKFLSPKKETSKKPPWTSPRKAPRYKQDFAEASTSKDFSKFDTKSTSGDSKTLLNLVISQKNLETIKKFFSSSLFRVHRNNFNFCKNSVAHIDAVILTNRNL